MPADWDTLHAAVSALAFAGELDPPAEALRRLCEGEWLAGGDWELNVWAGAAYTKSCNEIIPSERWQALRDGLAKGLLDGPFEETNGKPLPIISDGRTFAGVSGIEREFVFWSWRQGAFETAYLTAPDREEHFSARNIHVTSVSGPASPTNFTGSRQKQLPGAALSMGGRPPAADWEAAALELAGRYYRGDFKPATIAEVARALHAWASEKEQTLSEATARTHAKTIYEAFRAWEAD